MNYWIGVIGSFSTYNRFTAKDDFWFCLPRACVEGDQVAMYASQRMAKDDAGIFGVYEIAAKNDCKDGQCRTYGANSGNCDKPIYVDMRLLKKIEVPITFKTLKNTPRIACSNFIKRSMQATYFKISEAEFAAIQSLSP